MNFASTEKRVWSLLVRDFEWRPGVGDPVKVLQRGDRKIQREPKFQLFEVLVTEVLARIRPEYEWFVTPNCPDGGLDFLGRGTFLKAKDLGIEAGITIAGQCKKRELVHTIEDELGGSLMRLTRSVNPTFFVVAFSARLNQSRVERARQTIEQNLHRHCHILERRQVESLLSCHIDFLSPVIRAALTTSESELVLEYFYKEALTRWDTLGLAAEAPDQVLAGGVFRIRVEVKGAAISNSDLLLRWIPDNDDSDDVSRNAVSLLGPIGSDSPKGVLLTRTDSPIDGPFIVNTHLEFISYAVGLRQLGKIQVTAIHSPKRKFEKELTLPRVRIIESLRPRFYERPFRPLLNELGECYERSCAGAIVSIVLTGSGGAGKSRLFEEFSLEVRRKSGMSISVGQANNHEYPLRILANLLIALSEPSTFSDGLPTAVIDRVASYDQHLAHASRATIEALLGTSGKSNSSLDEELLLSVFIMLLVVRTRSRPLVLHLYDLHWCNANVLEFIQKLIWQLEHLARLLDRPLDKPNGGVMFVFEGRTAELYRSQSREWSTQTFEVFVSRLEKTVLQCRPFSTDEGREFARRLFEQPYSANRMTPEPLFELMDECSERISAVAGANPFHMLEHFKLLKQKGFICQNALTGLHYLVRTDYSLADLPETVSSAIQARWRYLQAISPELASLILSVVLLSEKIERVLFGKLWRGIAPNFSLADIERAEFLQIDSNEGYVRVPHENYYRALQELNLPSEDLLKVVQIYQRWFDAKKSLSAQQMHDQARLWLLSATPDLKQITAMLQKALRRALRSQDRGLVCRVLLSLLDNVYWPRVANKGLSRREFSKVCDLEIRLCQFLVGIGERQDAIRRAEALIEQLESRLSGVPSKPNGHSQQLLFQKLQIQLLVSRILMNFGQPAQAIRISGSIVGRLSVFPERIGQDQDSKWHLLEMEALHAHATALALGGEIPKALETAGKAFNIASRIMPPTDDSLDVMGTYSNILLAESPSRSERTLRKCLKLSTDPRIQQRTVIKLKINLAMALLLKGHRHSDKREGTRALNEALSILTGEFSSAFTKGRFSDAAAAALLTGLVRAVLGHDDTSSWFAQSVTTAARCFQLETLWRAHLNLATSLFVSGSKALTESSNHARAAISILTDTLSAYSDPELSMRYSLIRIPLAQAAAILIRNGDPHGAGLLIRFPNLGKCFSDPARGKLRPDRGGFSNHEWLRVGEFDYILY